MFKLEISLLKRTLKRVCMQGMDLEKVFAMYLNEE